MPSARRIRIEFNVTDRLLDSRIRTAGRPQDRKLLLGLRQGRGVFTPAQVGQLLNVLPRRCWPAELRND